MMLDGSWTLIKNTKDLDQYYSLPNKVMELILFFDKIPYFVSYPFYNLSVVKYENSLTSKSDFLIIY